MTSLIFRRPRIPAALLAACLLGGCGLVTRPAPPPASPAGTGERPAPAPADRPGGVVLGWTEIGEASWYGPGFHGRRTASGEVYDMEALTAAHPSLPFDTLVEVEHLESGRSVRLRINDRGPFVGGRIIDVSRRAARELGLVAEGVARVRVEVVELPTDEGCWMVQLGAFRDRANAQARAASLRESGHSVSAERGRDGIHRVRAGPFGDRARAEAVARGADGLVVRC